jgi:hypothetical protein
MDGKLVGVGNGSGSGSWSQTRHLRARQGVPIICVNYEMLSAELYSAAWSLNTK